MYLFQNRNATRESLPVVNGNATRESLSVVKLECNSGIAACSKMGMQLGNRCL